MAEQTDCPFCGAAGRLATNQLLDLYRCTKCKEEFWVEHQLCLDCASWADDGMDYCWFHASHHGIPIPDTFHHDQGQDDND